MPKKKSKKELKITNYRYQDKKRKDNPPIGLVSYEKISEPQIKTYAYDPHLSPQLVWANKPGLKQIEVEEELGCQVETVSLHVHERVSAQAIIDAVQKPRPKQLDLFAAPDLPLSEAVKFYQHDVDWSNRLILGDSLLVMNSLIEKEQMAGKVQMIYFDPPYGVKYASNFQTRIDNRNVKDSDDYLTREPEMIKAYRDTWTLGIHSYLTYMRDRLLVARELLTDSGSIFVQISDENVHHIRELMDEVFGTENFCGIIVLRKTGGLGSSGLTSIVDYLIWYAKNYSNRKYYQMFSFKTDRGTAEQYKYAMLTNGEIITIGKNEIILKDAKKFQPTSIHTMFAGVKSCIYEFVANGKKFKLPPNRQWSTTIDGMKRLIKANRLYTKSKTPRFIRFLSDFPVIELTNLWDDVMGTDEKIYTVQTNTKIIERCMLMTTDPGDLVLDPTCGSGTTAYVAEQWGRRWITIDTSRVALAIARQRLLTAVFPYYKLYDSAKGVSAGFIYKTVPHITLKSIAQNPMIDVIYDRYQPRIEELVKKIQQILDKEIPEWEIPIEFPDDWPDEAKEVHQEWRRLTLKRRKEIDEEIARSAPQEILYDQPQIDRSVVRVSGPFTVEAIPPVYKEEATPIGGEPEVPQEEAVQEDSAHIAKLIDLLSTDGVTFPNNKKMKFKSLNSYTGGIIHAIGEPENGDGNLKKVGISFGPLHGPVTARQVEDGLREANLGGFDGIIFCGFAFEGQAHAIIEQDIHPNVRSFLAHIRPDVILTDATGQSLLKTTASSQLFTVFGEPDIELIDLGNQKYQIEIKGVDVYDPVTGEVISTNVDKIAAWFVDTDYDDRAFCITQAYFPDKSAWKKIERALKGTLDPEKFELLTGHKSLPFKAGENKKAAVKVIDPRGNEVMKIIYLGKVTSYI